MKRKKILALLILAVMSLLMVGSLSGCKLAGEDRKFYTDYFFCIYNEDYTEVTILELTDLGKEQEILVIPKTINGVPVVKLGGIYKSLGPTSYKKIESANLKKLYIYGDYWKNYKDKYYFKDGTKVVDADIVVIQPSFLEPNCYYSLGRIAENIYYPQEYLSSEYYKSLPVDDIYATAHLIEAQISFYISIEELFFVDSYSADGVYYLPDNPTKEGYSFDGWVDEEGQPWDGNYPQSADEFLNLYAKWIKI